MKPSHSAARRILLILAASAVIVGVTVLQGKAIIGRFRTGAYRVRSGSAIIEPVAGSTFIRSYPVTFNGLKTTFAHYSSRLTAQDLVKQYASKIQNGARARVRTSAPAPESETARELGSASEDDYESAEPRELAETADNTTPPTRPHTGAPMLSSFGHGCSVLSYVTEDGTAIGIIAYDNAQSGGSDYFVGAMPAPAPRRQDGGDCPGREPPGMTKPAFATRTLCIENLGGVDSILTFYDAWGPPGDLVKDLSQSMAQNGWKERTDSSHVLTQNYEGHALISFARGHEQCLVAVDQEPKTGKIVMMVFWAERPWLPEGTAL